MVLISDKKKEKISEQILSILYEVFPKPLFTSHIAKELARDEEFTKKLLHNLESKNLIISIKKNSKGIKFLKRISWRLSNKTYNFYQKNIK